MTAPAHVAPEHVYDIELEQMLDDEAMCVGNDGPAVARFTCTCGCDLLTCTAHTKAIRAWRDAIAAQHNGYCGRHKVPNLGPDDITITPV